VIESEASTSFDDGKAPDALRTIGEVSAGFGIKQHILRYWEQQFPTLRPLKRSGGRRYYRPEDVALVGQIDRLSNRDGYTLKGARQVLESGEARGAVSGVAPGKSVPVTSATDAGDYLPQLRSIRDRLANALAA